MATTLNQAEVTIGSNRLSGIISLPYEAKGLVIFAHGSGSGRHSPRNNFVAGHLRQFGLATLLLDLLTPEEELHRSNIFDVGLLAARLGEASDWAQNEPRLAQLPLGYFGASTGSGAALLAAAQRPDQVKAVVSRGGRPDLAGDYLTQVRAPTLLLVGSRDEQVIALNRAALRLLACERRMIIVPGAGHLFEEPGTLDFVVRHAGDWFRRHLAAEEG